MSWEEVQVKDIGQVITGNTPPKNDSENYGGIYPFLKPTDMNIGERYTLITDEFYSEKAFDRYKKSYIPPLSTCVVTIGTIGEKMCLTHDWCFTNQSVNSIIPIKEKYDEMFIFYLLKCNLYQVKNANAGTSSGREHVNKTTFSNLKVNVPKSLSTQKHIANILSSYDDLIENNLKRIKLLEETAQNIYKEWFVNFRFPNYEHTEFDAESGLPVAWFSSNVGNFTDVNKSSINNKTAPQNLLYIDISSTNTGFYENPTNYKFEDAPSRARRIVKNGDSIFSTVRPNRKTYAYISNPEDNLIVSTGFAVLSPKNINDSSYIYLMISSDNFVDRVSNIATGVAYPAINQKDFESIEIIVPTEKLREQFNNIVSSSFLMKSTLLKQNQKLKEARDILLPRLMNRTIEV
jgi:type I restriction enzyme S subunit